MLNEPLHRPRGHVAAMGRGKMEDGSVENGKRGATSAETKKRRGQEDAEVSWRVKGETFECPPPCIKPSQWPLDHVAVEVMCGVG